MTLRFDYLTLAADGMKALGGVYGYLLKSGLPHELILLVFLRASQINGCSYCIDLHSRELRKAGVTDEKLMLLSAWREAGLFSEPEQAALRWTESVTLLPQTGAADGDYQAVSAVFDPKQVADLTVAIGLINVYNRIAVSARRGPDPH